MKTLLNLSVLAFSLLAPTLLKAQCNPGPPRDCGGGIKAHGTACFASTSLNCTQNLACLGNFDNLTAVGDPTLVPLHYRNYAGFYINGLNSMYGGCITGTTNQFLNNTPDLMTPLGTGWQRNNSGVVTQNLPACGQTTSFSNPAPFNGNNYIQLQMLEQYPVTSASATDKKEAIAIPLSTALPAGTDITVTFQAQINLAYSNTSTNPLQPPHIRITDRCTGTGFPLAGNTMQINNTWSTSPTIGLGTTSWTPFTINHTTNDITDVLIFQIDAAYGGPNNPGCVAVFVDDVQVHIDNLTATVTSIPCSPDQPAYIQASLNGIGPFTYNWSNGATSSTIVDNGSNSGTYTVTVTDANGCSATATGTLVGSTAPNISWNITAASCHGTTCNGAISVQSISGGLPPFIFVGPNATNGNGTFTNLCPGQYAIDVVDACGASFEELVVVGVEPGCWQQTSAQSVNSHGYDSKVGGNGNVFVVGEFRSDIAFSCSGVTYQPVVGTSGGTDAYVVSFDACGVPQWPFVAASQTSPTQFANARAVVVEPVSNSDNTPNHIYVTGAFDAAGGSITFWGGDGTSNISTSMTDGYYIAKYVAATGELVALFEDHNVDLDFQPHGITRANAKFYVAGQYEYLASGGLTQSGFITSVDLTLSTIQDFWVAADQEFWFTDIEANKNGQLYLSGIYTNQLSLYLSNQSYYPFTSTPGVYDGFTAKFEDQNPVLAPLYVRALGAQGNSTAMDIVVDGSNRSYVIGTIEGGATNPFYPAHDDNNSGTPPITLPGSSNPYVYVTRIRPNGNYHPNNWINYSDPSLPAEGFGITHNTANLFITGNFTAAGATMTFFNGTTNAPQTFGPGFVNPKLSNDNIFIGQMEFSSGVLEKCTMPEGTGSSFSEAIAANALFTFTTGRYQGFMDFNGGGANISSFGSQESFVVRNFVPIQYSADGNAYPELPFMKDEKEEATSLVTDDAGLVVVFPNPTNGLLTIECEEAYSSIQVLDAHGRMLVNETTTALRHDLDLSTFNTGIYFIRVELASGPVFHRIVKQ